MSAQLKPDPQSDTGHLDAAADQAIAMADGDMRSAIRSLILANEYLEMELSEVFAAVSKGFTRGEVWREPPKADGGQAETDIDLDNIPDWYD
jgi:hypothetical protein